VPEIREKVHAYEDRQTQLAAGFAPAARVPHEEHQEFRKQAARAALAQQGWTIRDIAALQRRGPW